MRATDHNGRSPRNQLRTLPELIARLARIEEKLDTLIQQRLIKEYYSTGEVARIVGRSEFTVRQWCRLRRVHAQKRPSGRGPSREWMISHAELQRIQSEGLLPLRDEFRGVS